MLADRDGYGNAVSGSLKKSSMFQGDADLIGNVLMIKTVTKNLKTISVFEEVLMKTIRFHGVVLLLIAVMFCATNSFADHTFSLASSRTNSAIKADVEQNDNGVIIKIISTDNATAEYLKQNQKLYIDLMKNGCGNDNHVESTTTTRKPDNPVAY